MTSCSARIQQRPQGGHSGDNKIGGRVLEVGVGTGISLPQYAPNLRIFGTDISAAMLQKAKKRVADLRLKNVEGLAVMDAEKLEFPDDSFDVVMAQYVVTAVPNPEAALDEFARVLRPGGETDYPDPGQRGMPAYAASSSGAAAGVRPLGFRTAEFAWSRYARWRQVRAEWNCGAPSSAAARPLLACPLPQESR